MGYKETLDMLNWRKATGHLFSAQQEEQYHYMCAKVAEAGKCKVL